jgi:poly(A) polymerase
LAEAAGKMRWLFGKKHEPREKAPPGPEPTVREALLSKLPSEILLRWSNQGMLKEILPDVEALRGISQMPAHRDDAFVHTMKAVDAIEPTLTRRWAALLHDIGKAPTFIETPEGRSRFFEHDRIGTEMVPEIMGAVGEDPETIEQVQRLVRLHMRPISYQPEWTDGAVRRLVEEAEDGRGPEGWADLLALSRADLKGYLPEPIDRGLWVLDSLERRYREILEAEKQAAIQEATEPRSPLAGDEILALTDAEPGPWVGELKDFLCKQVEQGVISREDKARATEIALQWLAEHYSSAGEVGAAGRQEG